MRASIGILLACLGLSACATLSPQAQLNACNDIETALRESPSRLQRDADAGDGHAQMAWSIALRYGLGGVARDPAAADAYRQKATAVRGQSTSFIWIAATKKTAGYLMPVTNYTYDIWPNAGAAVDACVSLLAAEPAPGVLAAQLDKGVCGGQANYNKLKAEWQDAASRR